MKTLQVRSTVAPFSPETWEWSQLLSVSGQGAVKAPMCQHGEPWPPQDTGTTITSTFQVEKLGPRSTPWGLYMTEDGTTEREETRGAWGFLMRMMVTTWYRSGGSSPGSIRTTRGLSEHKHQALSRGPSPISLLRPDPLYTELSTSSPPKQSPYLSVPVLGPLHTQQSQEISSPFHDRVQCATAKLQ